MAALRTGEKDISLESTEVDHFEEVESAVGKTTAVSEVCFAPRILIISD